MAKVRKHRVIFAEGARFEGPCMVPHCGVKAKAWNEWQKQLFATWGPVCSNCQPKALWWLLGQPSPGQTRMWCEFIEERDTELQDRLIMGESLPGQRRFRL